MFYGYNGGLHRCILCNSGLLPLVREFGDLFDGYVRYVKRILGARELIPKMFVSFF